MTKDQAKFILQVYRKGRGVSQQPDLEKALELLENDSDLQDWFQREQAFDEAFASKLAEIEAPSDLANNILSQVIAREDNVVEFPWWKQFSVLGAVASMILVMGLVFIPARSGVDQERTTIASLRDFANQSLKGPSRFASRSDNWAQLVSYLGERSIPAPKNLPGRIEEMPARGCMTLQFQNKPVGVICFGKNSKSHIFVVNIEDFPKLPTRDKPVLQQNPYASTAYWTEEGRHYLLVTHDPKELNQFVSF